MLFVTPALEKDDVLDDEWRDRVGLAVVVLVGVAEVVTVAESLGFVDGVGSGESSQHDSERLAIDKGLLRFQGFFLGGDASLRLALMEAVRSRVAMSGCGLFVLICRVGGGLQHFPSSDDRFIV
jgi:hypothetical protein